MTLRSHVLLGFLELNLDLNLFEMKRNQYAFQEEFSWLPLGLVYGFERADDMVNAMGLLIRDCIDRHDLQKEQGLLALQLPCYRRMRFANYNQKRLPKEASA